MTGLELNTKIYKLLSANSQLVSAINGRIYKQKRPDNSKKEDIVVNTISVSHDHPQEATSNINIHIPDKQVKIDGVQQYTPQTDKLESLTKKVVDIVKAANYTGISLWVSVESLIKEDNINEHYQNIRLSWIIY